MAQPPETIDYQSLLAAYAQRLGDAEGTLLDRRAAGDVGGREDPWEERVQDRTGAELGVLEYEASGSHDSQGGMYQRPGRRTDSLFCPSHFSP